MLRVLVLGGYGEFGGRLTNRLRLLSDLEVVVAGRSREKLRELQRGLSALWVDGEISAAQLNSVKPDILVDCTGDYRSYDVVRMCIAAGVNYIDLADDREFVCGVRCLDSLARRAGVFVISGASTVPGLSSAILTEIEASGDRILELEYGISPGSRPTKGPGTVRSVLGFVGRKLSRDPTRFFWCDLVHYPFPDLGRRWLSRCDCADLALFPTRFGVQHIEFRGGHELGLLHIGVWCLAWMVRWGVIRNLPRFAKPLKMVADWFASWGTDKGGMYLAASTSRNGQPRYWSWHLVAGNGDGPFVPTLAAAAIVKRVAAGLAMAPGARACVGNVSLSEITSAALGLDIQFSPLWCRTIASDNFTAGLDIGNEYAGDLQMDCGRSPDRCDRGGDLLRVRQPGNECAGSG